MRRGTTPTIKFKVYDVDSSSVKNAYVTLKQSDTIILTRELVMLDEGIWASMLTQEDTLKLKASKVQIQLKFKLINNTVIASDIIERTVDDILDEEVI